MPGTTHPNTLPAAGTSTSIADHSPTLYLWFRRGGRRSPWRIGCIGTKAECEAEKDRLLQLGSLDSFETTDAKVDPNVRPGSKA